ncbi:MAG: murein biosynthesis integral membrane protein MurJ [Candidatus Nealsonbacteria bacterium DGGOD1a]|nr:MAG: murein biosynthesis integral membrane protein MurJ [Candidatus Nealsonbacteria bacterium DGGOD1a]
MFNHFSNGNLINAQSRGIAVPAMILAVSAVASRLLGVLRDWLLAARFGAGSDLDVYFAAFRIPDFIYNVLVFGGITVAFLPLFSDYYQKDKESAWRFTNNILNVFFGLLALSAAVFFVFAPQLVVLVAPGFSPEQLSQTAFLSRLMFLSPVIFGIASIFSGVLQYFKKFLAYSLAAPLYNLGIIAGILFLAPEWGIAGAGVGVILGALLYLAIQIAPAVKCGFRWRAVFDLRAESLKRVFGLMLPRTLGIAANQINLIIPTIIGSTLAPGSITIFNLASNIFSLPVGIVGVSWATAAFAPFSKYFTEGRTQKLAQKFSQTLRQVGFLAIPAAVLIFFLSRPLVDFLYRHGEFDAYDAEICALTLMVFCLGIYFAAAMPALFRLFFAMKDTASPTWSTVVSVAANIAMSFWFVFWFAPWARILGLALAYGIANLLQFAILWFLLRRKNRVPVLAREICFSLFKSIGAGIFMALALYLTMEALPFSVGPLSTLLAGGAVGGAVYLAAAWLFRTPEIKELLAS